MKRVLLFALPIIAMVSVLGIGLVVAQTRSFSFRRGAVAKDEVIEEAPE